MPDPVIPPSAVRHPASRHARGAVEQSIDLAFRFLFLAVIVLAGVWLCSGITQVEAGSRAVVLRWGAVDRVHDAGLVWAWPRPIEEIIRVPGGQRQLRLAVTDLDYRNRDKNLVPSGAGLNPRREAYVLTGDMGVVHLRSVLTYRVSDPAAYVLAGDRLRPALERIFCAVAVRACAGRILDQVLVAGPGEVGNDEGDVEARERLRSDVQEGMNRRLASLGLGVEITRVDPTAMLPDRAKEAFNEVGNADQQAAQSINEAQRDATRYRTEAAQAVDAIRQEAESNAKETINQARIITDPILALIAEDSPQRRSLLLARLYRERMGAIIHRALSVLGVDGRKPTQLIIPGDPP